MCVIVLSRGAHRAKLCTGSGVLCRVGTATLKHSLPSSADGSLRPTTDRRQASLVQSVAKSRQVHCV